MADEMIDDLVHRLFALHARSLATFLAAAPPWEADQQHHNLRVVSAIAGHQLATADRLGEWLVEHRQAALLAPFPTRFASLHDLSADYLLPELLRQQDDLIAALDEALPRLRGSGPLEALVQEALGMAKAHRDMLADLLPVRQDAGK